ncbi:MAG: putative XRE-type DNA-binding protein [Phenylobacterium sp.]|jgi:predicted XRE-type DNA-binding protein
MKETTQLVSHITPVGGNVFADLGFTAPESNKLKLKAQLMSQISEWIKQQKLKQEDAAKIFNVNRPRVSDVMRGKVGNFTIDALVDMVEKTGSQVVLSIEEA